MQSLIEEYKASESEDYIDWGAQKEELGALERMPGEDAMASNY